MHLAHEKADIERKTRRQPFSSSYVVLNNLDLDLAISRMAEWMKEEVVKVGAFYK
jgi:hypothetical protein